MSLFRILFSFCRSLNEITLPVKLFPVGHNFEESDANADSRLVRCPD